MSILWTTLKNSNFILVHSSNTPNERVIAMCHLHMLKKLTILNVHWVLGLAMCGGSSLRQIADAFDLSRQRIHQIVRLFE